MLIATAAVSTIFGLSFGTLFPAWSVTVLGDSTTNGFLQSARWAGLADRRTYHRVLGRFKFKGRVLTLGTFIFPLSLLIWSAVRWLPLSLLLLVAVGIGSMFVINMTNILVQSHVIDELRGRVMSVFTLSFFGMMPVGALLAGALAEVTTEPVTVALGALVVLAFAAFLWLRVPRSAGWSRSTTRCGCRGAKERQMRFTRYARAASHSCIRHSSRVRIRRLT